MKEISYTITGQDYYTMFNSKYCYGWWRDGRYLYIGKTIVGVKRWTNHHVINKKLPVQADDVFHLWYCNDEQELGILEIELIELHKPLFNISNNFIQDGNVIEHRVCKQCTTSFIATRNWQEFCGTTCKAEYNNTKRKYVGRSKLDSLHTITCSQCNIMFFVPKDDINPPTKCTNCINPKPVEPAVEIKILSKDELQRIWSKQG